MKTATQKHKKPAPSKSKPETPAPPAIGPAPLPAVAEMESPTLGLPRTRWKPTRTSLELPEDVTLEEWSEVGRMLGSLTGAVQWWWGDWLRKGKTAGYITRDRYDQAEELAGYGRATLWNLAWVADNVNPHTRREELSWGHHAEVAGLKHRADQEKFLAVAVEKKWTRLQLRHEVKGAESQDSKPVAAWQRLGLLGCLLQADERLKAAGEFLGAAVEKRLPDDPDEEKLADAINHIKTTAQHVVELAEQTSKRFKLPSAS